MKKALMIYWGICLLFCTQLSFAQSSPTVIGGYPCNDVSWKAYKYNASGVLIDSGKACQYLYDDPTVCRNHFFFNAYPDDSIEIKYTWTIAQSSPNGIERYIQYRSPSPFSVFTGYYVQYDLYPTYGSISIPAYNPLIQSVPKDSMKKGSFLMYHRDRIDQPVNDVIRLYGFVNIIPRINKVWIEAPKLCVDDIINADPDDFYSFYVKTDPTIKNMWFYPPSNPTPNPLYDPNNPSTSPCLTDITYEYVVIPTATGETGGFPYNLQPTGQTHFNQTTGVPSGPQEYKIPYYRLKGFVNAHPGRPATIKVMLTNHLDTFYREIPLIIESTHFMPSGTNYASSSFHFKTYDVTANEVWTPTNNPLQQISGNTENMIRMEKEIRIHPGASLTINDMTIEFGKDAQVIVETNHGTNDYGSILTLNNSTLTAFRGCGNEDNMWYGVTVEGNASHYQTTIAPNVNGVTNRQGALVMNNSTLSYAQNAVRLYDGQTIASSGGIILANNSTFYNNSRAAEFMKYLPPVTPAGNLPLNVSQFNQCNFTVDNNFPSSLHNFSYFISGWAVRGVKVDGCTFSNNGYQNSATGIYGHDFGVVVENSDFKYLTQGIRDLMIADPAALQVYNNVFNSNKRGITLEGVPVPDIYGNNIANDPNIFFQTAGLVINTGSGYNVQENTISKGIVGAIAINTGSDPNKIQHNSFSNMIAAGVSNYRNQGLVNGRYLGLQFLCNEFNMVGFDLTARGNSVNNDGIALEQGSLQAPAGNQLYSGSFYNIYNPSNEVVAITYYYNQSDPTPSTYGNVTSISTSNPDQCDGIEEPIVIEYPGDAGVVYGKIRAKLAGTEDGMIDMDSLHYWVDKWASPYGLLMKTDLLMGQGEPNAADNLYDNIDDIYEMDAIEEEEFTIYGRALLDVRIELFNGDKSLKELDANQVTIIEDVANNAKLWAKVRAQNWLNLYDARTYPLEFLLPEEEPAARPAQQEENTPAITELSKQENKLYPNPVTNQLQVYYHTQNNVAITIEIYDMLGRKKLSQQLQNGLTNMNVENLETAVYYYKISEDEVVTMQGKIIKQ